MAAISPEYSRFEDGETLEQQLETQRNFFPILAVSLVELFLFCEDARTFDQGDEISVTATFPLDVRRMSAICLKNGVTKFWRSLSSNSLCKEDKTKIKEVLQKVHLVEEKMVFEQLIVATTKIARYDYPKLWPDLTPSLVGVLNSSESEETKLRSLIILYKVLKELSSKRLMADKKNFRETTQQVFPLIGTLWQTYLGHLQSAPSLPLLHHCLTSLKLLRSFLTYGFEDITQAGVCLEEIIKLATPQLEHRLTLAADPLLSQVYDKYLKVMVRLLNNVQEKHPRFFGRYLEPVLNFAYQISFVHGDHLHTDLVAQSLHLLSDIVSNETYDVFKLSNKGVDVGQEEIGLMNTRNSFFSEERLHTMTDRCISHNLKLTPVELQDWQECPEEFSFEETRHVELFSVKAASEHFLLNLTATFQDIVCPYIVTLVTECSKHDRSNLETVLMIDSVYSVTVVCSYDLFDYLDIETWFTTLQSELKQEGPFCTILKRRILEVIGRWVTIKLCQDRHPAVYELCIDHMSRSHDLVVRLTAASALEAAVGDFAFYPSSFSGYLKGAVERLYDLLMSVQECETRVRILGVLNSIIVGCSKHVKGFVGPLIEWLPGLWTVAEDHVMLQTQLLLTANKLSRCLLEDSVKLYPFTEPVLVYVMTKDPEMLLLEDGLTLWLTLVENAPCTTPHLIDLLEGLDKLLQYGSESLKTTLHIVEATILLDPPAVTTRFGSSLLISCCRIYPDVSGEARVLITSIFLTLLKTVPAKSWLAEFRGMFHIVINSCRDIETADYTKVREMPHRDNRLYPDNYSKVFSNNIFVISYLIILDLPLFTQIVGSFNDPNLLKTIVQKWLDHTVHFFRMEHHKLSLLALLTLAASNTELAKYFFGDIIRVMATAVRKCSETDDEGNKYDCLMRKLKTESDYLMEETQDYQRRKALTEADVTSKVDILVFVRSRVAEIQQSIGLEAFYKLSEGIDKSITEQITEILS
eukprot:sb/3479570/